MNTAELSNLFHVVISFSYRGQENNSQMYTCGVGYADRAEAEANTETLIDIWSKPEHGRTNVTATVIEYAPIPVELAPKPKPPAGIPLTRPPYTKGRV